jgi:drug/metabolite transporter (DMT)-like permease
LNFDNAFLLAVLSGIFYSIYLLVSKKTLSHIDVLSFMVISLLASTVYLAIVCIVMKEPFFGFSNMGWLVLFIQAVVCQLMAWLSISFATKHMRPTRISLSLLGQALITAVLAWLFLDEKITLNMIIGGMILLIGIRTTFYTKTLSIKNIFNKATAESSLARQKKVWKI